MTAERTYKVEGFDFLVEIADGSASEDVPARNFVDCVTLQEILFQYLIRLDTELSTTFRLDAIANRYDYIKAVNLRWFEL